MRGVLTVESQRGIDGALGEASLRFLLERIGRLRSKDVSARDIPAFAVRGDRVDVAEPELSADLIGGGCAELCHPWLPAPDGLFGELTCPLFDQ